MTRRRGALLGAAAVVGFTVVAIIFASAMRRPPPERAALEYGRALYANDADALWRLISEEDHRAKDEATFRRQQRDLRAFTRDAVRQLAGYITATPVKATITGGRASVTLRFRLPDANAAAVRGLMHDWDEDRLNQLSAHDRQRLAARVDELHTRGELPTIEADETLELVREADGWKVFLNWAGGVRVTFTAAVDPGSPLEVSVAPPSIVLAPGERVRVSVRVRNIGPREITTRVSHRIEPEAEANHLALLQCPLLLPARLAPGAVEAYESEYLLLADTPVAVKAFTVTYRFPGAPRAGPG